MHKVSLTQYFKEFRVKTALKLVIAGTICILVNNIFHLELGYFSALFCMLLLVLFHGEVFKSGAQAFAGAVVSGGVSIIISFMLVESKAVYMLVMSAWIFLVVALLYRNFLVMLISGVAATMVMYNSIYNSVTITPELFQNYLVQLGLSILVSAFVDDLLWPHRTRRAMGITLKTVFQDFSELFKSYAEDDYGKKKDHTNLNITLGTFGNLVTYVNRMQKEEWNKDFPTELYMKVVTFSRGTFLKMEILEEYVLKEHSFMKDKRANEAITQILGLMSESYSVIAASIGTKDIVNIESKKLEELLGSLHAIYKEMHEVEGKDDAYFDDLHAFGGMLPILDEVAEKINKIEEAINIFHRGGYREMMEERVTHTKAVEQKKARTFFTIDGDSAKAGIKTVVIFLLLMFGEEVLGLPGGNQVVFFAILFGVVPNLGQAYMKSRYGIIGVFSGLTYSFISLTLVLLTPHFLIVIALYALGAFIAGFVASSSRDISAAGLQAGLLFPFGILLTTGPGLEISDAFTRFLALLSAVFIGLIVQHTMWPVNPYKSLLQRISKSISLSGKIFQGIVTTRVTEREKVESLIVPLAATLPTTTSLLHDAEYVIRDNELHREDFIRIIESIEHIYADIETLKRTVFDYGDSAAVESHRKTMGPINDKILKAFDQVSEQFSSKNDYTAEIRAIRSEVDELITEYRKSGEWRAFEPKGVEKIVLVDNNLDSLLDSLYKISSSLNSINGVQSAGEAALETQESVS